MGKGLSGNNVASIVEYMALTGVSKVIGLSTNELNKVKDKGNSIVALAQMGNTTDIVKRWRLSNNESALLDFLVKNKNNPLDQKKVEDMIADGISKDLISAQLMVGSEGTLGIITKIVFRLIPLPTKDITMLVPFNSAERACEAVSAVFSCRCNPLCSGVY